MEIKAYAKINLTLEVLGRRSDGYHEVRTVLQTIDLADVLRFTPAQRLELECSAPGLGGEHDLVVQAAGALRRATGCGKGAKIRLEKHIPIGMGLGGGSSDAASTLKALNSLWELGLDDEELRSIAASLGSDVPFFISGGTALGEGRGEVISDLPPLPRRQVVLLCLLPARTGTYDSSGKTGRLYSMLTKEHHTDGSRTRRAVESLRKGRLSDELLFNVFERVAPSAFPRFDGASRAFLEAGAEWVHLSGTGPALYSFVSSKAEGNEILNCLKRVGLKAYCVSTNSPNECNRDG